MKAPVLRHNKLICLSDGARSWLHCSSRISSRGERKELCLLGRLDVGEVLLAPSAAKPPRSSVMVALTAGLASLMR
jgi:hypothetical protein